MPSRLAWSLVISLACVACSQEAPDPESVRSPVAADDWLKDAVSSPAFAFACKETPGCTPPGESRLDESEVIWRLRITRSAEGAISIGVPERTEVMAGTGVPLSPPGAKMTLVGLDAGGKVIAGRGLRFPTELRVEFDSGEPRSFSLQKQSVDTIGYLSANPDLARIEVRDESGNVVANRELPTVPSSVFRTDPLRWLGIEAAHAVTRPFGDLPPHCAHIIVLQGEFQRDLGEGMEFSTPRTPLLRLREWLGADDTIKLVRPGPYQMAATQAALARMTPLLCQSISRIAFGVVPEAMVSNSVMGAVASASAGDLVVINVAGPVSEENLEQMESRRLWLQGTITHEGGHAAETLLTFKSSNPSGYQGAWTTSAHKLAEKTIDNVRLEVGIPMEWQRLHRSFKQLGWAADYGDFPQGTEDKPAAWRPDDLLKGGFMSQYASTNWAEDFAEHVTWPYLSKPTRRAYAEHGVTDDLRQDAACLVMREYGKRDLPSNYAAVYTKLHFLQDLGLVRPQDVSDCTGDSVGLHIERPGFHIWQEGELKRSMTNDLKARLGTAPGGVRVFELEGKGEASFAEKSYPAEFKLRLELGSAYDEMDRLSWPRGAYLLGLKGNNNFTLRLDDAAAGNFDTMNGFVLVAESSGKRIAGSAVLQRVMRLHAPIPVPERYDPPLVVRFAIEK